MPRGDQVARLYTLVMDLARSRRGVTAAALAARGDRKLRTVYRDLDALEQSGFPVTKLDGGKWKLIDGWDQRIPFPLTAGELLSLHIAGEMMAPLSATRAGKDFAKLHKRLTGSKPRRENGGEWGTRARLHEGEWGTRARLHESPQSCSRSPPRRSCPAALPGAFGT